MNILLVNDYGDVTWPLESVHPKVMLCKVMLWIDQRGNTHAPEALPPREWNLVTGPG